MTTVRIPPTLRTETGGERQVHAAGDTVRELLDDLMSRFPGLRRQLVQDDEIAPFVNVYVEGEDVRTLEGLDTPVSDGSTVILLPAMAGGAPASAAVDSGQVSGKNETVSAALDQRVLEPQRNVRPGVRNRRRQVSAAGKQRRARARRPARHRVRACRRLALLPTGATP